MENNNPFANKQPKKQSNYIFIKFVFFLFVGLFLFSCASNPASFTRPTKINGISFLSQRNLPDSNARVPESKRPRTINSREADSPDGQDVQYNHYTTGIEQHLMILLLLNVFQAFIIAVLGYNLIKRKE